MPAAGSGSYIEHNLTYDYGYLVEDATNAATQALVVGPDKLQWDYDPIGGWLKETRTYDGGNLVWKTTFDRSQMGEITDEIQGLSGSAHAWEWEYGFAGELLTVTYPSGLGLSAGAFDYDGAGRLERVQYADGANMFADYDLTYEGFQLQSREATLGGIKLDLSYDGFGRLSGIDWNATSGGGWNIVDGQHRTIDLANRVIARKRSVDATGDVFEHDGFGRMTEWYSGVSSPLSHSPGSAPSTWSEVERYTLSKVYGRTQVENEANGGSPVQTSYTSSNSSAHFYTQVGGESRSSWNGRLETNGTHDFFYDAWARLTEVKDSGTGQLLREHQYDALGRRVREMRFEGGETTWTRFVYWGLGLAASYEEASTAENVRTYGFVGGGPDSEAFVRVQNSDTNGDFELLRDAQGSILALLDRGTGAVIECYRYSPWGEVSIEDGQANVLSESAYGNTRLYMGRLWDAEVGIYDLRARWYEPDMGGFLSPDPLEAIDSWNMYQYGHATPATFSDPFGLVLVAIDGSMSKDWLKLMENGKYNSHVRNFYESYVLDPCGEEKAYWHGPNLLGLNTWSIHRGVLAYLLEILEENPDEEINIVGFSRGGHIAIEVARALEDMGYEVNFVGTFDPVDNSIFYGDWSETMPANVENGAVAYGDPNVGSRPYFDTVNGGKSDPNQNLYHQNFDATHSGMGGNPWEGDQPAGMTESRDNAGSQAANDFIMGAAKAAGIELQ